MTKRTSWNSTLRPRSDKKAAQLAGKRGQTRSALKRPSVEDLKQSGKVMPASTLARTGKLAITGHPTFRMNKERGPEGWQMRSSKLLARWMFLLSPMTFKNSVVMGRSAW